MEQKKKETEGKTNLNLFIKDRVYSVILTDLGVDAVESVVREEG